MDNRLIGSNFSVLIAPIELRGNFSAVSGLGAELEYEEIHEGGNFTSPIYLPTGMRYNNIVPLSLWFTQVQTGMHLRYPMIITMMDSTRMPVKIWTVLDAMPVKIEYSSLDAMSDSVSITSIELIHGEIITVL